MIRDINLEKKLKNSLNQIPVSPRLDAAIELGLTRARREADNNEDTTSNFTENTKTHTNDTNKIMPLHSRKSYKTFGRIAASFAGVILSLAVMSNASAALSESIVKIPVIGGIVKALTFVDHKATGGEITDGVNLDSIIITNLSDSTTPSENMDGDKAQDNNKQGMTDSAEYKSQSIYISFSSDGLADDLSAHYEITEIEAPNVLSFKVSGIRMMDMKQDFATITQSPMVEDVYSILTLDDSMVRFNMVLAPGVTFEVFEHSQPAQLEIKLTEGERIDSVEVYSVRSYSYPNGESFTIMEEALFHSGYDYHILKDVDNEYVYEFGRFESVAEADLLLDQLKGLIPVIVQPINNQAIPEHIQYMVEGSSSKPIYDSNHLYDEDFLALLPDTITPLLSSDIDDPNLKAFIIETLSIPEDVLGQTKYYYNWVDLDGDGYHEVIAVVMGPYTSGSGGDTALIAKFSNDQYELLDTITTVRTPIIVSNNDDTLYDDLITPSFGGGAAMTYRRLVADGSNYPTVADGLIIEDFSDLEGFAIICNDILFDVENGHYLTLE